MCGVAGIFHSDGRPALPAYIKAMTDALVHRGPDGEGYFTDGCFGVGHRRLAIIDLSPAAHQPMQTADGRFVLAYNGELYNFQELRLELEAHGRQFRSRSDTEVLLQLLVREGARGLVRLNGMFAFALWDRDRQELLLARDRFGIKPLYYARLGDVFLFGSEVKAILQHPEYRCEIDHEALLEYCTFQNFLTDRTLFKDVRLLPPGSLLRIGRNGAASIECYWDFSFAEPVAPATKEDYAEKLDRLFTQAVGRQLIGDVPVSSYLSGGMDSGSVTAVAARQISNLKTFCIGFDMSSASGMEIGFDERARSEHMSYIFKTEHYEAVLKAGDMERIIPQLVWHLEEPRLGQCYPNFYAARLASRFGKVVLSGAGGDELFGGYPWRYYRAVANTNFDEYIDKYYAYWQRLMPNATIRKLFRPIWPKVEGVWTRDIFHGVFQRHADRLTRPEDYVNHSLYFEAKTFLQGLLVVEDKLSMAHSLETRVPFLDNDLVDFAQTLPVAMKLANFHEIVQMNENELQSKYNLRTKDGKMLLRAVMERYITPQVTQREKQGFSGPDASWFRGESIDYVRSMLLDSKAEIFHLFDRQIVNELVDEHLSGRRNLRLLIWSLVYLEQWCRTFLRRPRSVPQ